MGRVRGERRLSGQRWRMTRRSGLVCVVTGVLCLSTADAASGGGMVMVAPERLGPAACRPATEARAEGPPIGPIEVLGCVRRSGREFLAGAQADGRYVCFYVAPEGGQGVGPCLRAGRRGFEPSFRTIQLGRAGRPGLAYGYGVAPRSTARVRMTARSAGGRALHERAASLRVSRALAEEVGAPRGFSFHLGVVPRRADTCRGLSLRSRRADGEWVDAEFDRFGAWGSGVPLPGSRRCAWARVGRVLAEVL